MSFQVAENWDHTLVSRGNSVVTKLPRLRWSQAVILALLLGASVPAGAHVLFPHDYSNGEIMTFAGGTPGKDYELRVAKPGGGIVKASEALLDVSFLDHRQVKIAPLNVAPDVYRAFYGPEWRRWDQAGAGGCVRCRHR